MAGTDFVIWERAEKIKEAAVEMYAALENEADLCELVVALDRIQGQCSDLRTPVVNVIDALEPLR